MTKTLQFFDVPAKSPGQFAKAEGCQKLVGRKICSDLQKMLRFDILNVLLMPIQVLNKIRRRAVFKSLAGEHVSQFGVTLKRKFAITSSL